MSKSCPVSSVLFAKVLVNLKLTYPQIIRQLVESKSMDSDELYDFAVWLYEEMESSEEQLLDSLYEFWDTDTSVLPSLGFSKHLNVKHFLCEKIVQSATFENHYHKTVSLMKKWVSGQDLKTVMIVNNSKSFKFAVSLPENKRDFLRGAFLEDLECLFQTGSLYSTSHKKEHFLSLFAIVGLPYYQELISYLEESDIDIFKRKLDDVIKKASMKHASIYAALIDYGYDALNENKCIKEISSHLNDCVSKYFRNASESISKHLSKLSSIEVTSDEDAFRCAKSIVDEWFNESLFESKVITNTYNQVGQSIDNLGHFCEKLKESDAPIYVALSNMLHDISFNTNFDSPNNIVKASPKHLDTFNSELAYNFFHTLLTSLCSEEVFEKLFSPVNMFGLIKARAFGYMNLTAFKLFLRSLENADSGEADEYLKELLKQELLANGGDLIREYVNYFNRDVFSLASKFDNKNRDLLMEVFANT